MDEHRCRIYPSLNDYSAIEVLFSQHQKKEQKQLIAAISAVIPQGIRESTALLGEN